MSWKIGIVTYNVAMKKADEVAVDKLLSFVEEEKPNLVVVGMQEVAHAETLGGVVITWLKLMVDWMTMRSDLVLVAKNFQATNQVSVFMKKSMIHAIQRIQYRYGRNTMGGLTGHKGSIGIRINFRNGQSIVFVDSHFIHDVASNDRRIAQYFSNRICCFPEQNNVAACFWFGDLNFRVELEPRHAHDMIQNSRCGEIIEHHEQLTTAMRNEKVMIGFQEHDITFEPTYRLVIGSNRYDLKRTPSWCDRILYKGDNLKPVIYNSLPEVLASDHLPVYGVFNWETAPIPSISWNIVFEHLAPWYSSVPLIARFTFLEQYWSKKGSYMDWIGVFPAGIYDCTSALRWIWVATCFEQMIDGVKYYVCEFPALPTGSYRLGYFSYYDNCIVGLSKSFKVSDIA